MEQESTNVPKSGVPYSVLNQNQHEKGKDRLQVICCQMYFPTTQGSGFYVILIEEGARVDG